MQLDDKHEGTDLNPGNARKFGKHPFAWQEKRVLRLIRKLYTRTTRAKMICLYVALTWIASDFVNAPEPVQYYNRTISHYSGLDTHFITTGLKDLVAIGAIEILQAKQPRKHGRFIRDKSWGPQITCTPDNLKSPEEAAQILQALTIQRKECKNRSKANRSIAGHNQHDPKSPQGGFPFHGETRHKNNSSYIEEKEEENIKARSYQSLPLPSSFKSYAEKKTESKWPDSYIELVNKIKILNPLLSELGMTKKLLTLFTNLEKAMPTEWKACILWLAPQCQSPSYFVAALDPALILPDTLKTWQRHHEIEKANAAQALARKVAYAEALREGREAYQEMLAFYSLKPAQQAQLRKTDPYAAANACHLEWECGLKRHCLEKYIESLDDKDREAALDLLHPNRHEEAKKREAEKNAKWKELILKLRSA